MEQEKQRQQELERQREAQRKQQRVDDINKRREAFLSEDYLGTDYGSKGVKPLKIDPDYEKKLDALNDAQAVASNDNIIDHMRDEVLERTDKILNEDPIARRKKEKEEAELLAEEEAKNAEPIRQSKTVMVSEELRDSFFKSEHSLRRNAWLRICFIVSFMTSARLALPAMICASR